MATRYEVKIDELEYGNLTRKLKDWPSALATYSTMKKNFSKTKCRIRLIKIKENDFIQENIDIYSKHMGVEYTFRYKIREIENILNEIEQMKREFISTLSASDSKINKANHCIEICNADELTESKMRNLLRTVEETAVIRRNAKLQIKEYDAISNALNHFRGHIKSCNRTMEAVDQAKNTEKAKYNSIIKDIEYKKVLQQEA